MQFDLARLIMVSVVLAVAGLFFAARGHDLGIRFAGWCVFAFGTLVAFRLGARIAGQASDN